MFSCAASQFLQAADRAAPPPAALYLFRASLSPQPATARQIPPARDPAAARALPANAPCSPNPYRATTYSPYTNALPDTKSRRRNPVPQLRAPIRPANSAMQNHLPQTQPFRATPPRGPVYIM